jgi:hypothetical protein
MKRFLGLVTGIILCGVTGFGIVYGLRASAAQGLYYQAKYSSEPHDIRPVLGRCMKADALYPHNYRFCELVARKTLAAAQSLTDPIASGDLEATAEKWCNRGLAMNPRDRELCWLKTAILERRSREAAIRYWKDYTDWHFWHPQNQYLLGSLYARNGHLHEAERIVELLAGRQYGKEMAFVIMEVRARLDSTKGGVEGDDSWKELLQ